MKNQQPFHRKTSIKMSRNRYNGQITILEESVFVSNEKNIAIRKQLEQTLIAFEQSERCEHVFGESTTMRTHDNSTG